MDKKTAIEVWNTLTEAGFTGASIHTSDGWMSQGWDGNFVVKLANVLDYNILHKDDLRLVVEVCDKHDIDVTLRTSFPENKLLLYLERKPSNGYTHDEGKTPNTGKK